MIGIIEYPPPIKRNIEEWRFPIVTMDVLATLVDIIPAAQRKFARLNRSLDGISLRQYFEGSQPERPLESGIGIHGSFPYGDTNVPVQRCPMIDAASLLGDVPPNFSTAGARFFFYKHCADGERRGA